MAFSQIHKMLYKRFGVIILVSIYVKKFHKIVCILHKITLKCYGIFGIDFLNEI